MHIQNLFSLCSAPAAKVRELCPDCLSHIAMDNADVQKTVSDSLEKFNKESGLANRFALLKIARATCGVSFPPAELGSYLIVSLPQTLQNLLQEWVSNRSTLSQN